MLTRDLFATANLLVWLDSLRFSPSLPAWDLKTSNTLTNFVVPVICVTNFVENVGEVKARISP